MKLRGNVDLMRMRRGCGAFVAVCVLLAGPGRADAQPAAPKPAASSAGQRKWTGPADEQWLARAVEDELRRVSGRKQRDQLLGRLGKIALARIVCGRLKPFSGPTELVHAMQACKYLALLEKTKDGRELAEWLLGQGEIRRLLFRALGDVRSPEEALKVFRELQADDEQAVLGWPDLAVAFATAQVVRSPKKQPMPATVLESFGYYTDAERKFRYDIRKMPYELSRYLANTRLSLKERQWAYKKYFGMADPGAAYHHVPYDWDHYLENKPKLICEVEYSLENLDVIGGVCVDQAYYASEVSKAIGIPAVIVHGRGRSGIGHAWFTYFRMNTAGRRASWTGGAGRYVSQAYFTGDVHEAATNRRIMDSELSLVGSAALLPLWRREEAEAAVVLAKLAAGALEADPEAADDVAPLKQLAATYRDRFAADPAAPRLETKWIEVKRRLDMSLVEDLIDLAIDRNLAYTPAWVLIARLRGADRLPAERLDRFFDVLIKKTARAWPEHSCSMVLRIVPTLPDAGKREKVYKRCLTVYGRRPDLKGRILIALGDESRDAGQKKQAVRIYRAAAVQSIQVPGVVTDAAARAEKILLADNDRAAAIRLYQMLFTRTRKERAAEEIRRQTPRYKLGTRLAELLEAEGKGAAAKKLLSTL